MARSTGTPEGLAPWFLAGFVAGAERALSGQKPQREYFTQIGRDLLKTDNPGMRTLLEQVVERYAALTPRQRARYTGRYAGLDIQLPTTRLPAAAAPKGQQPWFAQARGDAVPARDDRGDPPKPADLTTDRGDRACTCCDRLEVRLERIHVKTDTSGPGADDVLVTGLSTGVIIQGVQAFVWLTGPSPQNRPEPKEMNKGDETTPSVLVAVVKPDSGCRFSLDTEIRFWEIDNNKIDELLRRAIVDLVNQLSAKAGVLGAPGSVVDLIGAIVDALVDLIDLRDQEMDAIRFSLSGKLCSKPTIEKLGWAPPWGSQPKSGTQHERVDDNTTRLSKTMKNLGGEWETSLLVQRICT
jgi:hypothetical protein